MTAARVQRTYLLLMLLSTLAASLIWGINTLFLLDAGLSLTGAFVANGAFSLGMMIFEIPTGVVADTAGRRVSYILGAATLLVTTLAYLGLWYWEAPLGWWIVVSALIGLGFTFFSGATEAWLVDALAATGYEGPVDSVFGKGQSVMGAATLIGTIAGGFLGQINLGIPYALRAVLLLAVMGAAFLWMHDLGHQPHRDVSFRGEASRILRESVNHGFRNPPARMFMFAAPFATGVLFWSFYAFQPYLLELFDDPNATYLAGLGAAVFAVAQMAGGASVRLARRIFRSRTGVIIAETLVVGAALAGVGFADRLAVPVGFWLALALLALAGLLIAVSAPTQQAYLNEVIPSEERATILSTVSLMGSAGGAVAQPALGKVADVYSLGIGYVVAAFVWLLRLPFVIAIRRLDLEADRIVATESAGAQ